MCDDAFIKKKPFLFAISGWKNSGKTTLITRLIPVLQTKGYRVATIKHDVHDFQSDVPGTDSYLHQKAGAYGTAIFSANRFMITKACENISEAELVKAFPEADIILLEGFKSAEYPKYEVRAEKRISSQEEIERLADRIIDHMEDSVNLLLHAPG